MGRLIDGDALIAWIKGSQQMTSKMKSIICYIKTMPTVDAVSVVRCKDCKHCYEDGEHVKFNVCELNHNKVQSDDWYCADGERKESE